MKSALHLIHSDEPGGAESVLLALRDGLEARGTRCLVGLAGGGWLAERLEERGATVIPLTVRHAGDWRLLQQIRRAIGEHQIDIVHTHLTRMNLYGGVASSLAGVPSVATLHGKDFGGRWGMIAERLTARCADRAIAVSADLAEALKQRGWPAERIRVIYNGIDPGDPPGGAEREAARRELGIEDDALVVGSVGRLEPVKAYSLLLEAAEQIRRTAPGLRVLFVGDGSQREALEREARYREIDDRVIFAGTRADARRLLSAMDIFVLCSHSEGLSISLLEAMCAGLPVVATEVGGNPEVVQYGVNGLLVPPADSQTLAAAILFLINRPDVARTMGRHARSQAVERFSVDAMLTGYEALYDELLSNRTRGGRELAGVGRGNGE